MNEKEMMMGRRLRLVLVICVFMLLSILHSSCSTEDVGETSSTLLKTQPKSAGGQIRRYGTYEELKSDSTSSVTARPAVLVYNSTSSSLISPCSNPLWWINRCNALPSIQTPKNNSSTDDGQANSTTTTSVDASETIHGVFADVSDHCRNSPNYGMNGNESYVIAGLGQAGSLKATRISTLIGNRTIAFTDKCLFRLAGPVEAVLQIKFNSSGKWPQRCQVIVYDDSDYDEPGDRSQYLLRMSSSPNTNGPDFTTVVYSASNRVAFNISSCAVTNSFTFLFDVEVVFPSNADGDDGGVLGGGSTSTSPTTAKTSSRSQTSTIITTPGNGSGTNSSPVSCFSLQQSHYLLTFPLLTGALIILF